MWITAHPFRVAFWTGQTPKLSLLFSIFLTYKLTPVIFAETWRYLSVWRRAVPSMWRVSGEKESWTTQNKGLYEQSRGLYILWWGGSPQQHGGKKYMSFTFIYTLLKRSIWASWTVHKISQFFVEGEQKCHFISQVSIFLKLVEVPLNHAIKSVYNTRIRRNHVPLLNKWYRFPDTDWKCEILTIDKWAYGDSAIHSITGL